MGPYLAIHRLRDETGTLRVRLVDLEERVLWEGMVSTGLSPARANPEQLELAVGAPAPAASTRPLDTLG